MTDTRAAKINGIAYDIVPQVVDVGPDSGPIAVVGWGSTYGSINRAISNFLDKGVAISHIHLTNIWPLPANLGKLLARFDKILVPEMNNGQLLTVLRSEFLVPAKGINKVNGQPFKIRELEQAISAVMEG
jgi:2-oxoglutarate ferredoxin oxidoreductase subunit alpha